MAKLDLYAALARQLRADSIRCSTAAGSGHPTSSLSAADLMAVLLAGHLRYDWANPKNPANDHLIFSKGHASPLIYALFRAAGAITDAGADDLPQAREPARGPPDARPALGRRRDRLARPGPADRGRRRARGQARARTPRTTSGRSPATASWPRARSGRGSTTRATSASRTSRRSST